MNLRHAGLLLLCSLASTPVMARDWNVREDLSWLRFSGTSQGESFEGSFARYSPQIRFDPLQLERSRFDIGIDLASADTRNEERDETLVGSDFFDIDNYPAARFVATEFVAADAGFEAHGSLELRGTRQPVTLRFQWTPVKDGVRLEGEATLDRIAFGIGLGDWADAEMIGHEVRVATTLMLQPAG